MAEHSQGEYPQKVREAVKKLGHAPSPEELLQIKEAVRTEAPAVVVEPSKEQKINLRIQSLTDSHSRRELEDMLRTYGVEPSREAYPDKRSLAKAIAEKEAEA